MWLLVLIWSVVLVCIFHYAFISPHNFWKIKNVPHPKPTFFFGNMGELMAQKVNVGQLYQKIYNTFNDKLYVGYYKFLMPGILLRDLEIVKNVLIKDFQSFHDNDIYVDENIDPVFGKNPFCLKGDRWKRTRSLVTSSITPAKLRGMFNVMDQVARNMVKYLDTNPESTSKDGLEAKELSAKFTTDCVASCAFGIEGRSFEDPNAEFRAMGRKMLEPTTWNAFKINVGFLLPSLTKILRIRFFPADMLSWFTNVIEDTVKYREDNKIVRNDYLDLLISLMNNPETDFKMIDVVAQAMTFYGDGFETSSNLLSFIFYELAAHPEYQQTLREEIETVYSQNNGELNYDLVQEMTFLDKVFNETLRMRPPAPSMSRVCTKPFRLPPADEKSSELIIPPNTPITVPIIAIHYDPSVYPNPEEFDPERFSEENKQNRPKCSLLGFGEGPRMCLGQKFAAAQVKAAVIHVIKNFHLTVNKKTQEPIEMDPKNFLYSAKGGLWLNFSKIK